MAAQFEHTGNERVFIGLGTNLGAREENLRATVRGLAALPDTQVLQSSTFLANAAWGVEDQPEFLNAMVEIRTRLTPSDLLTALKQLERKLGRTETYRWGPRVIDIDLILYGRRCIDLPDLVVPHPQCLQRSFVIDPLREIAPEVVEELRAGTWATPPVDPAR
ncbi:MAG: 2-amino-4-hydroxy-6-hydroxymethyldihydropteridine diphosphokinase [Panacagrimonas sp.]